MPQGPIAVVSQYSGGNAVAKNVSGANQLIGAAGARVIRKISVTTVAGAAGIQIWDGAVSGDAVAANLIYNNPTAVAAGTVIDLNMPVSKGILITIAAAGVVAVSYN